MKNLYNYNTLSSYASASLAIDNSYLYINGVSTKYLFDNNGDILLDNENKPVVAKVLNFNSKLTRISEDPGIFNNDEYFFIEWDRKNPFDYQGLAVICDEVVYVVNADYFDIPDNKNEIRIRVKRNQNNTKHNSLYPENTIIRSVINITYKTIEFNFENRSDVVSTNLFSPVIDNCVITITDDDMMRWANYSETKWYELKRKTPIYIFNGDKNEVVCDYVGFLDSFNINSISGRIEFIAKDKMSTLWNEDITSHKVYKDITIADFLSEFLNIPRNMIIYPLNKNNGVVYDENIQAHTWKGSIYEDKHFFKIDVLATKDFSTYSELLQAATQELMFRMKFDTYERLVIQSDVFISNEDILYDNNIQENYSILDDNEDITSIQQDNNNLLIINKIQGEFIERNTFYDKNGFLLNHLIFDKYYNVDKIEDTDRIFENHSIYNPDNLDNRTSESTVITEIIDGKSIQKTIHVAVILSDSNYSGKTTWYRWSVIPHIRQDKDFNQVNSVSWGWVFKGFLKKEKHEEDYVFTEAVKYQKNQKLKNISIMKYDPNKVPEFSVLTKLSKDDKGETLRNYRIHVGEDVKHLKIGDYVMVTDGKHDFMCKISDVSYGTEIVEVDSEYTRSTDEQAENKQDFRFYFPTLNKIDNILLAPRGIELTSGWEFNPETHQLTGTVSGGQPYRVLENSFKTEEIIDYTKPYSQTKYIEEQFTLPFPGVYKGTISLQSKEIIYGDWEYYGEERVYNNATTEIPSIGSLVSSDGITGGYEYRTVYTNYRYQYTSNYKSYYATYVRQQRSFLQNKITHVGTLYLNTYKYTLYINGTKNKEIQNDDNIENSTITVMCGYDKDYSLNYWGRHTYLEDLGYVDKPMDLQLFYIRNEFPYVYEYSRDDNTSSMEYPILPGETLEFSGDFGGIESGEKKFAGMVDSINSIYGQFFGIKDTNGNDTIDPQILYSREYHQPVPIYIRSNKVKPIFIEEEYTDSKGQVTKKLIDKFNYETFDNRDLCVEIKSGTEEYKESLDYLQIDNLYEMEGSKKDIAVNITNMNYSDNYFVRTLSKTKAYRISNFEKVEIDIPENTRLQPLSWIQEDCEKYYITREYKIKNPLDNEDTNFYYVQITSCKLDLDTVKVDKVYGKTALRINNQQYKFNVGDVLKMDKSNEFDINTQTIYMKYSDARWLIRGIERAYEQPDYDLLYLDYEFPVGENNAIPLLNHYKYNNIVIFQEFGIKGNPYTEEIHNIKYENVTSVEQYGEYPYEGISGKFLKMDDLNTALSYIIDGFAAISKDTTKFVMPLGSSKKYELELFDIVRINEGYYTGMQNQTGIITGIKYSYNGTETKTTYTVFTLGKYKRSNSVSIKGSQDYEPIELPEYSEEGNSGKYPSSNLLNKTISKTDSKLGNIMLLQIASDNLSAQFKETIQPDGYSITLDNISSYFDNSKDLKTKKYYTDMLLDKGQELFISNGSEFIYAIVVDNKKEAQSYEDYIENNSGNDSSTKSLEKQTMYVGGIVTQAKLQVKQRGVFDTTPTVGQKGDKVGLYQIASMANENGNYTTAMLIGDKPHREYLEFSIDKGMDVTSTRGRMLFNTNKDWFIQAKQPLYNYYDKEVIDVLTEEEVQDYLGKGIIQIGQSSIYDTPQWKPNTPYIVGDWVAYQNGIYECNEGHTSSNNFVEFETFWTYRFSVVEYGQFLRYSPVGGLEIKGNIDIDSGSFKINDYNFDNNFMHLTSNYGYLGLGTQYNSILNSLLVDNPHIVSFIQIGDYLKQSGLLFYSDDEDNSKFAIKTQDLDIQIFREYNEYIKRNSAFIMNNTESILTLNEDGHSFNTLFQIGYYDKDNLSTSTEHIYYSSKDGQSEISIKTDKGFIGNETNYIYFDKPKTITVSENFNFSNREERDSYFGIYDKVSGQIIGGTIQGTEDFNSILEKSKYNIHEYILVSGQYQYFDYKVSEWIVYVYNNSSLLYMNNGMQQIGNSVKDTVNNLGYSGFYFGMSSNGLGDISSGQYIKFDGHDFMFGEDLKLYYGNQAISFKDIVLGGFDNNVEGSVTFIDNTILVYNDGDSKYQPLTIDDNPVKIIGVVNSPIINKSNIVPSPISVKMLKNLTEGKAIRFTDDVTGENFECIIKDVDGLGEYFTISKVFTTSNIHTVEIENSSTVLMSIGDLKNTPDIGEPVRFGNGVFVNPDNQDSAIGLYLRDNYDSHFKFDTIKGLDIRSNNGIINLKNTNQEIIYNELYFDKFDNSYISLNNDLIQLGKLKNITLSKLQKYNGNNGFYIGASNANDGYLAYSPENGLSIRGSLYLDNGSLVDDVIDKQNEDINNRIDQEINDVQQMTIYSDVMPTNLIWKKQNLYFKYDINSDTWKSISLSNNTLNINNLYKDSSNKHYIYNSFTKKWMLVQVVSSQDAPSQMAKTDTIWVNSKDNVMYRYNPGYSFNYDENYAYNISGNNMLISINIKTIGLSDFELKLNLELDNSNAELKINNKIIPFSYFEKVLTAKIPYGILTIGNNMVNIAYKNNKTGKIILTHANIKSIGIKKWDISVNPTEIYTNDVLDTKNSIFTLKEIPIYKNFKKCSGKIYGTELNTNKLLGTGTKFLTELNNGDIVKVETGYEFIVDEIKSNTELTMLGIVEEKIEPLSFSVLQEKWEDIPSSTGNMLFGDLTNPTIQTIGRVVRHGLKDKIEGIQYDVRVVIDEIRQNKIYTKRQKVTRLYPFEFTIDDLRIAYNDPTIIIKPKDVLTVIHYYALNESATFTYFPRDRNLHKGISIMDTALNNIDYRDFILSSSSNDKTIFIQTDKSKLFFSSDPYTYDELLIAKNGTYGRLTIGDLESDNFFSYDSETGLDITTQQSINIVGKGTLNMSGSSLTLESSSQMLLKSGSMLDIQGKYVNISSSTDFTIESANSRFTSKSSLLIESKKVDIRVDDMSIVSDGGTLLLSNDNNEIYLSPNNTSRILLNTNISEVGYDTVFQLGESLMYNSKGGLMINNANISLISSNNIMAITPEFILSRKITNANMSITDGDLTFIEGNYLQKERTFKRNIDNIFEYIYTISTPNKEIYTSKNIIEISNYEDIVIVCESNIGDNIDIELINISNNQYIVYTPYNELDIQILIK